MAGQKSSVSLMKGVPLIGGIAGGTLDAVGCRIVGKHARKLFETAESSEAPKKRAARDTGPRRSSAAATKATRKKPAKKSSAKKSAATKSAAKKSSGGKKSSDAKKG